MQRVVDLGLFVGLSSWREMTVIATVTLPEHETEPADEESVLNLKTQLILRSREVLRKLNVKVVDQVTTVRLLGLDANDNAKVSDKLDPLFSDEVGKSEENAVLATAIFQL